ncbi:MAG: hypothetical protein U9O95_07510 [Candidatus Marinimicrobia bacterium]|nr:hypothetical protein [Candidatus Neomarinimicrobiota bacterium]
MLVNIISLRQLKQAILALSFDIEEKDLSADAPDASEVYRMIENMRVKKKN